MVLESTSTMEVERRFYGGGNITFFHSPPKFLIDYSISTMIHLHYGGGSYNVRREGTLLFLFHLLIT